MKALRVPDGGRLSNSRLKPPKGDVAAEATAAGAGGLVFIRCFCVTSPGPCACVSPPNPPEPCSSRTIRYLPVILTLPLPFLP